MKTLRSLFAIFVLLTAGFFAYLFCQQHSHVELRSLSILIISGTGLLLFFAGLICWLIFDRWSTLKTELKEKETEKLKTEYDKKKEFFEEQTKENEKRRVFEGRPKPEQQIVEIMKAVKLTSKNTKENVSEPTENEPTKKSTEKDIKETEKFDTNLFDKAIEELKNMNQNDKQE